MIKNSSSDAAFLGSSDVSVLSGYELLSGEVVSFEISHGDGLYAIAESTGHPNLHVTVVI